MSEHWTSDGAFTGDLAFGPTATSSDRWSLFKEIAILGGSAWLAAALISGWSAARSTKDPKAGMWALEIPLPVVGPIKIGADWLTIGAGLIIGILFGDYVGPFWQTVAIGAALGGGVSVLGVHHGAVIGSGLASGDFGVKGLIDGAVSSVRGMIGVGGSKDRVANLPAEAQSVLAEYEGT